MALNSPAEPSDRFQGVPVTTVVLAIATGLAVYLCWLLIIPFLKAITWALALAVAAHPLHHWVSRKVGRKNLAAALSALLVVTMLLGPGVPLIQALIHEAVTAIKQIQDDSSLTDWQTLLHQHRWLAPVVSWFQSNVDLSKEAARFAGSLTSWASSLVADSAWFLIQ